MHTTILDFITAAIGGEQVKRPLMAEDKRIRTLGILEDKVSPWRGGKALSPARLPTVACPMKKHRLQPQK